MSESSLLFYHGLLAMTVLSFYVLFFLFSLSSSTIPIGAQQVYQHCPRVLANLYWPSCVLIFVLLGYLFGEYGLYFLLGYDDVDGMVRFRNYLTLSEGAGLTPELLIGGLAGTLLGGLLYKVVDLNLMADYRPIDLNRKSLSPSEVAIKEWLETSLLSSLMFDLSTLAQYDGLSININLATGSIRPEGSGRLRSPAHILKSLTGLKRSGLTCLRGEIRISSPSKYHSISVVVDATFMGFGRRLRLKEQLMLSVEERVDYDF